MNSNLQFSAARFWRRLGGIFYDVFLLACVLLVAVIVATLVIKLFTGQADYNKLHPLALIIYQIYFFSVASGFLAWFWVQGGQTLGMRAWRIRVVNLDNQPISWGQAFSRVAVAWSTPGIGLVWALFDQDHQALYDRITKTRLVIVEKGYVPPLKPKQG